MAIARHTVRRCIGGLGRGLGARRSAGADAGRGSNHRHIPRHWTRRIRRRAARIGLHRQSAARRSATGTGYFLSHQLSGPFQRRVRRAESWAFSYRARRPTLDLVRLVGRHHGPGLGHDLARGGMRSYAAMRRNAPDFFIHCGDNIYADCPIAATRKLPDGR